MAKESINKDGFKVGDKVVRFKNSSNGTKTYDTPFIITKVSLTSVYDDNDCGHDSCNIKLFVPKSEIINDYQIF